jgi:hypothetical protein
MYRIAELEQRADLAERIGNQLRGDYETVRADLEAVQHDLKRVLAALSRLSSQPRGDAR